jgi:transcriptional regulator with XRE-family HTH domain
MAASRLVRALHTPAYRRFVQRLILARKKAGMTQAQVAHALKRPQSFVSKCEAGQRRVDPVELQAFAKLYRVPLSFFLK